MDNIIGVILAAGYSSRMNEFKMTRVLLGLPVIEHLIQNMYDTCNKILIVTGFQYERLWYLEKKYPKVKLVFNQNYPKGMFSSVFAGLEYVNAKQYFITPGDYPAIRAKTFRYLANYYDDICLPAYKGKTGHPVLLSKRSRNELLKSHFYSLEQFINNHPVKIVPVKDAGILMDIDDPYDFMRLEAFLRVRNNDHNYNRRYQLWENNSINRNV